MMTKRSTVSNVFAKLIACLMLFWVSGCFSHCDWCTCTQPGETLAEGQRRHCRNLYVNQENLIGDIDRAMLSDRPSQGAPLRLPPPVEPK